MKQLVLIPIGGLANRFYAISSAITFSHDYNIKLKIIWFKDKGLGADFHSLFELSEGVAKSKVEIIDAKWYHYIYDRPRKKNFWLSWLFQRILFDKLSYEKAINTFTINEFKRVFASNKSVYLVHCYEFYPIQRYNTLVLKDDIRRKVDLVRPLFNNVIGIHIRRSDNIHSIQNSPLSLFVDIIRNEIELDSSINFFVASDSESEKQKLKNLYGDRILTYGKIIKRNSEEGIKEALVELYLLSYTKKIYGSACSTFSLLASKLSGIEIRILSIQGNENKTL